MAGVRDCRCPGRDRPLLGSPDEGSRDGRAGHEERRGGIPLGSPLDFRYGRFSFQKQLQVRLKFARRAIPPVGFRRQRFGDDGAKSGEKFVAVFNLGDAAENISLPWKDVGIDSRTAEVRDLWLRRDLGPREGIQVRLRPHASVMYRVR